MTAASAAAISFLPGCTQREDYDVVIVGAGIAGLNTALLLRDLGLSVVVLEASSQVGGRIKTVQTNDGLIDVGASQIGFAYARVRSACRKLGLTLVPEDRDLLPFGMHFQGSWIDPASWETHPLNKCVGDERIIPPMMLARSLVRKYNPLTKLDDWMKPEFAHWDMSLRDLLTREEHSKQAIELSEWTVPGVSLDDTSLLRMFQEQLRGDYERRFSKNSQIHTQSGVSNPFGEGNVRSSDGKQASIYNIEGGCQQLPIAMAEQLGDLVRLNTPVVGVDMTANSATATCANGRRYRGRHVVSALPFSVLRDLAIKADNNESLPATIRTMPYANTARLFAEVKQPFWEQDGLPASFSTDGAMGMFWAIDNHDGRESQRAMFVLVGKAGQSISSIDRPEEFLISKLEEIRPASKGLIKTLTYKDWANDPLQKGCGYSIAPGKVREHVSDITKPWQAMHFAGEHTRRLDFGMESALESSERVVHDILKSEKIVS